MIENKCSYPCKLVRRLGILDVGFASEYSDDLAQAEEYPHGVMSLFAIHLCREYAKKGDSYDLLLTSVLNVIEEELGHNHKQIENIVEVSFIETIFYNNGDLFYWILSYSGSLLRFEILSFQAKERGYRVINAIKEVFGPTPPESGEELMSDHRFLQKLVDLDVPFEMNGILDPWKRHYGYRLERKSLDKYIIYMTSYGSVRDSTNEIQVCG